MPVKISVVIQCQYFQRRLCWMLSSMLQQEGLTPDCRISASVAFAQGLGNPTTEAVIAHFREFGLDVQGSPWPDASEFQYRGLTRNRQLEETDADWIIFADTDMVYPPGFFAKAHELLTGPYRDNPHCLFSQRFSTELEPTRKLIDRFEYPKVVSGAHGLAYQLPGKLKGNVGAGYCQIANVKLLKHNFGYYQVPGKHIDWSWAKRQKAKSDMHFRRMLGGEAIPLPVQIHLQHERDADYGKHVEIQR